MKFARIGAPGAEEPVVVHQERLYSLKSLTGDIDGAFLDGGPAKAAAALAARELPEVDAEGLRFGSPIARPSAVISIGRTTQPMPPNPARSRRAARHVPQDPQHVSGPDDPVTIPPVAARPTGRSNWAS